MMDDIVQYRSMQPGEEVEVFDLLQRTFHEFVAPDFSQEGIDAFFHEVNLATIRKHLQEGHFIMLAVVANKIVGMLDIRDNDHITFFFVDKLHHRKGIGRELLDMGTRHCQSAHPTASAIDVHASPYSVPIYEKLGFQRSGQEAEVKGIWYVPMKMDLNAPSR